MRADKADHPSLPLYDARQIHRPQERLSAHEPDRRWRGEQVGDALVGLLLALGRDAKPDIGQGPEAIKRYIRVGADVAVKLALHLADAIQRCLVGEIIAHSPGSLRQHLERVPMRLRHHREDAVDDVIEHALVEQIGRRIDKDHARPLPAKRRRQHLVRGDVDPARPDRPGVRHRDRAGIVGCRGVFRQARRHALHRVAIGAAGRDDRASRNGIPRRLRPFDCAPFSHWRIPACFRRRRWRERPCVHRTWGRPRPS